MKKKLALACITIAIILVSMSEAKGGRGNSRSSSHSHSGWSGSSSSKSNSGNSYGSFFGSRNSNGGSKSNYDGSISKSGYHAGEQHRNGGWVQGFLHNRPFHYVYRPTYIRSSYHAPDAEQSYSHYDDTENYADKQNILNRDDTSTVSSVDLQEDFAVGYTIGKALSSDFFSIFNVVHDISKYPEKIKNKEFVPSTTESTTTTSTSSPKATTTTEEPIPKYNPNFAFNDVFEKYESFLKDIMENTESSTLAEKVVSDSSSESTNVLGDNFENLHQQIDRILSEISNNK